ncbi:hypothetical protein G6F56_010296 [Rhizopus delemar]|nr:hypothetical protein G6F56_010296 [Rhizopus delemar]
MKSADNTCQVWMLPLWDFSLDSFSNDILCHFDKTAKSFPQDIPDALKLPTQETPTVQTEWKSSVFSFDSSLIEGEIINEVSPVSSLLQRSSTFFKNKLNPSYKSKLIENLSNAQLSCVTLNGGRPANFTSSDYRRPYASTTDLQTKNTRLTDSMVSSNSIEDFEYNSSNEKTNRQIILQPGHKKKGILFFRFC